MLLFKGALCGAEQTVERALVYSVRAGRGRQSIALLGVSWEVCIR